MNVNDKLDTKRSIGRNNMSRIQTFDQGLYITLYKDKLDEEVWTTLVMKLAGKLREDNETINFDLYDMVELKVSESTLSKEAKSYG